MTCETCAGAGVHRPCGQPAKRHRPIYAWWARLVCWPGVRRRRGLQKRDDIVGALKGFIAESEKDWEKSPLVGGFDVHDPAQTEAVFAHAQLTHRCRTTCRRG